MKRGFEEDACVDSFWKGVGRLEFSCVDDLGLGFGVLNLEGLHKGIALMLVFSLYVFL